MPGIVLFAASLRPACRRAYLHDLERFLADAVEDLAGISPYEFDQHLPVVSFASAVADGLPTTQWITNAHKHDSTNLFHHHSIPKGCLNHPSTSISPYTTTAGLTLHRYDGAGDGPKHTIFVAANVPQPLAAGHAMDCDSRDREMDRRNSGSICRVNSKD